jgi:hypothetical protein
MGNPKTLVSLGTQNAGRTKYTTQETKNMSNMDPTQVLENGKQFLLLIKHPPCYSSSGVV